MATITRGFTFGVNEQVTNTKLHTLVDSATISNITQSDINTSNASLVSIQGSSPSSPAAGNLWYDTTNGVLRLFDGSTWQPVSRGYVFTNRSGSSVVAGDILILDISNSRSVKKTTTADSSDAFGIALHNANDVSDVIVITEGFAPLVNVAASTSIGDYLSTSTTSGKASNNATAGAGTIGRALTASASAVAAQIGGGASVAALSSPARFSAVDTNTATRLSTAGSGTQIVTHSLGVKPSMISCHAHVIGLNAYSSIGQCYIETKTPSFAQSVVFQDESSLDHISQTGAIIGYASDDSSNKLTGAITAITTSDFTITWTSIGTLAANTINLSFSMAG